MSSVCGPSQGKSRGDVVGPPVYVNYQQVFSKAALRLRQGAIRKMAELMAAENDYIKMGTGFPSPETFPFVEADFKLRDGSVLHVDKALLHKHVQYGVSEGYPALRNWMVDFQRRVHSPPTLHPDHPGLFDLMITSGATEAIHTILRLLLNEGDWILVEEATFPVPLDLMHPLGSSAQSVRVDMDGIVIEDLEQVLTTWHDLHPGARKPKLLYVIPSGGNPTGITMSLERKRAIYEIARAHDLIILEDDAYYFLDFAEPRIPSFLSMDADGRVLRVDSFSKVIAPGLRTGLICGPQPVLQKMRLVQDTSSLTSSGLSQLLISQILRHWGHEGFLHHAKSVTEFYKCKIQIALNCAEKHLTGLTEWTAPRGGIFLWLKVLGVPDSELITNSLRQDNVLMVPGWPFTVSNQKNAYIRVSVVMVTEDECDKAFSALAKAIRSLRSVEM